MISGNYKSKKISPKTWMFLMLSLLLLLAGCGKAENGKDTGAAREKILLWTYYETEAQINAMDELVEGFNQSQSQYEAAWEYVPMTEFTRKLSMAYTEQDLPDIAVIDNPDMPACIKMGMFEDITDLAKELDVENQYYSSLLHTVTYDGRIYGLPSNCNNVALIYNKELLAEQGLNPPETWKELQETARRLTTDDCKGFLLSAMEGEQGAFQILPWILSAGEELSDIGGTRTVQAFTYINSLIEDGSMSPDCINYSQIDVARVFVRKEAAMIENGPWILPMLDAAGMNYGICPLPVKQKQGIVAGGEDFGILKGKNIEGAKAFFRYFNQNAVMERFCETTCALPARKDVDTGREQLQMKIFLEQMPKAVVRSDVPAWNRISHQLSRALYDMSAEKQTPEHVAKKIRDMKKD